MFIKPFFLKICYFIWSAMLLYMYVFNLHSAFSEKSVIRFQSTSLSSSKMYILQKIEGNLVSSSTSAVSCFDWFKINNKISTQLWCNLYCMQPDWIETWFPLYVLVVNMVSRFLDDYLIKYFACTCTISPSFQNPWIPKQQIFFISIYR